MLTDGCTDGRMHDGQKVITIAHPEQSSGELKRLPLETHYGLENGSLGFIDSS